MSENAAQYRVVNFRTVAEVLEEFLEDCSCRRRVAEPDGLARTKPFGEVDAPDPVGVWCTWGFDVALRRLERGERVTRSGWNGKGMFLFLVRGSQFEVNRPPLLGIYPEGTEIDYHAHIDMRTATGQIVPWTASQTDLLAKDWHLAD